MNAARIAGMVSLMVGAGCADLTQPVDPVLADVEVARRTTIRVTDLGTLGGLTSNALALNTPAAGRPLLIVGESRDASGRNRAAYWYYDAVSGPAPAVALTTPGDEQSTAFAVNQAEEIAGWSYLVQIPRAIRWTPAGSAKFLGDFGGGSGQAAGINALGQIAGYATAADALSHLFLWDPQPAPNGSLNDLGASGVDIQAVDVNLGGTIVGGARLGAGDLQRAFVWRSPGSLAFLPDSGRQSYATAVNYAGVVVGFVNTSTVLQAVRWTPNPIGGYVLENLGLGSSQARDINNAGEIVGSYRPGRYSTGFYLFGSVLKELPRLTYAAVASEINERGEIVGLSYYHNTYNHAVLWTNVREP